ncbi:MAG: NAD(P)/FAD-dependent oxidoreductase [Opitutales bacterium]|nr:NAD(P)/FAD-dependent oxidoreductase [Opitutales bacterium]
MNDRIEETARGPNGPNKLSRREALKMLGAGAGVIVAAGAVGGYAYRRGLRVSAQEAGRLRKARFVVAGGSIGGLTVAARLLRGVPGANVTIIEPRTVHHYQPGYTLVGAGVYKPEDVLFDQESLHQPGMRWIRDAVAAFEPERNRVVTRGGQAVEYDYLVVALGVEMDRNSVAGFEAALETPYAANIYDLESAVKYRELAKSFAGGDAVFTYPSGYVKCGGAPQKISWLSEDLWRRHGKRGKVEVHFHTPQPSLFPVVPVIDKIVMPMMEERGLHNHYRQNLRVIDVSTRTAIFEEETSSGAKREVRRHYDLLHPMPRFRTPEPLRAGPLTADGIGGQLQVDRHTLRHKRFGNVFGVGDCAATGAPKTAATIRKQAPVVVGNLFDVALDREPAHAYDGTSGCPLLTRYGRCMMFEFDFEGNLVNEWIYQSTKETRLWWNFKVHGLKRLYRHVMINGWV